MISHIHFLTVPVWPFNKKLSPELFFINTDCTGHHSPWGPTVSAYSVRPKFHSLLPLLISPSVGAFGISEALLLAKYIDVFFLNCTISFAVMGYNTSFETFDSILSSWRWISVLLSNLRRLPIQCIDLGILG